MRFEHLVQINDSRNPAVAPLTREQLWFGLLCRAENAVPFIPGLEICRIISREPQRLERELCFGSMAVRDVVWLDPEESVRFETAASPEHAGGSLLISIEERASGELFLRFLYETTLGEMGDGDDARYAEFVKSAYRESDIDTVRVIRMISVSNASH